MHSLRRATLRTAMAAASRTVSTTTRVTPVAARAAANCNAARITSTQGLRFFSLSAPKASEEKQVEEAQRTAQDAPQEVEESVTQTQENIQESMQEVAPRTSRPDDRHRSVFVRNLVFELNEDHLKQAFAKYGEVESAHVARDPRGMSKGFGFVAFATEKSVEEACKNVNGSFWHGRRITCIPRESQSTPKRKTVSAGRSVVPTPQLFIGNIPYETTDAELNRLFKGIPNLKDVRVAVDRTTGWPRGFAHADFTTVEAATEAKTKLEGVELGGRTLRLDFADGFQRRSGRSDGESP